MSADALPRQTGSQSLVFEVDVLVQRPITWRVEAANEAEAREKALVGEGEETTGVDYTYGEVVEVRRA